MSRISRNQPCPCGSGLKVKKCHPVLAGQSIDDLIRRAPLMRHYQEYFTFFRSQPHYAPLPDASTGWSYENFRKTGCPYATCDYETESDGICGSPGCGVGCLVSSLAPIGDNPILDPV